MLLNVTENTLQEQIITETLPRPLPGLPGKTETAGSPNNAISPERHEQLVARTIVEKKRKELRTPRGAPVMISYEHIQRHFKGSGTLGASITGWENAEEMFLDSEVWDFVRESAQNLSTKSIAPGEAVTFTHDFDRIIGYEGIVKISELPPDTQILLTVREGYYVNIVETSPPPTRRLHLRFLRDINHPAEFKLHSAWSGTVEAPKGGLKNPDWKDFAFYAENI